MSSSFNPQTKDTQQSNEAASSSIKQDRLEDRIKQLEQELSYLRMVQARKMEPKLGEPTPPNCIKPATLNRQFQEQILMLTDAMPHMVWISDAEGNCSHANNRFYEYTGILASEDDGWAWVQALYPDDLQKALEMGNEAALENKTFSMELRCRGKDGVYRWHLMHSIPFFDPDSGSTKWYGTTVSIQEQKSIQEQLRQSEQLLSLMADAIPHMVFASRPDGVIDFWNHRWFEYTGLSQQQSSSDAWQLLIHPKDREKYLSEWQMSLESGDTFEVEFRLKRVVGLNSSSANNGYLWHLARAVSMRTSEGEIVRWFGTWTDIEAQKCTSSKTQETKVDQNPHQRLND